MFRGLQSISMQPRTHLKHAYLVLLSGYLPLILYIGIMICGSQFIVFLC